MESATVGRRRALGRAIGIGVATENENAPERVDGWKIRRGIRGVVEGGPERRRSARAYARDLSKHCVYAYLTIELDPVFEGLDAELSPAAHRARLLVSSTKARRDSGTGETPATPPEMHPWSHNWEGSRSRPSIIPELHAPVNKGRRRRLCSRLSPL